MNQASEGAWWRSETARIIGLFAAALLIRWWAILPLGDQMPIKDGQEYSVYAINLLRGRGFGETFSIDLPSPETLRAFRMPLYPIFLAALYSWFGISFWAVRLVQGLLGAVSCLLIYRIARHLCGRRVALVAALLAAVYPALIAYTGLLMTETFFITLILLAVERCVMVMERPTPARCAGLGMTLGLVLLTRTQGIGFVMAILVAVSGFALTKNRMRLRSVAIVLVVAFLTYSPWLVRNWLMFHRLVPFTSQAGVAFGIRNSEVASSGIYRTGEAASWQAHQSYGTMRDETVWSSTLWQSGWRFIARHPATFLRYVSERALLFWGVDPALWRSVKQGMVRAGFYGWILFGFLLMWRSRRRVAILLGLLILGYATPLWLVGNGDARIRVPIEPFLLILAAYPIDWRFLRAREREGRPTVAEAGPPLRGVRLQPEFAAVVGAAVLIGAGPLGVYQRPGVLARRFDDQGYVRSTVAPGPASASQIPAATRPLRSVAEWQETSASLTEGSPGSSVGQRVSWQGGIYYNMYAPDELRKPFAESSVFLVNINLTPTTFGQGLIVVVSEEPLPEGLYYEDPVQGTGTIIGRWHRLLVVKADQVVYSTAVLRQVGSAPRYGLLTAEDVSRAGWFMRTLRGQRIARKDTLNYTKLFASVEAVSSSGSTPARSQPQRSG